MTGQLLLPYQLSHFRGSPRDRGSSRVPVLQELGESAVCFKIFRNCIVVNVTSSQRIHTGI